jgi:hypothetical protein
MRNYVRFFWAKINYNANPNPPNPVVPEVEYIMGQTQPELDTLVQAALADLKTDPINQDFVVTNKGNLYFLMDKENLSLLLANPGLSAMQLIDQFNTYPSYVYSGPDNTPRDGWTDVDGVKRKPPPSDKPVKVVTFTSKNVLGKQTVQLSLYLELLLGTWETGISILKNDQVTVVTAPKRWLDWLQKLIDDYLAKKVTPTQVYAALALVDFASSPPRLP